MRIYTKLNSEQRKHVTNLSKNRIKEKRNKLLNCFGNSCSICGYDTRITIHKIDGIRHKEFRWMSWREINDIITNHNNEYVSLCYKCHKHTHWCMEYLNLNYNDIKKIMERNI